MGGIPASEELRVGAPANPDAFLPGTTSAPIVGHTWDPRIDHTSFAPDAVLDFVIVSLAPANAPSPAGTVLVDLGPTYLFFRTVGEPGAPFDFPIPDDCGLVGTELFTQGGSIGSGGEIELANALDVVAGSI